MSHTRCLTIPLLMMSIGLVMSPNAWGIDINDLPPWVREALFPIEVSGWGLNEFNSQLQDVHFLGAGAPTSPSGAASLPKGVGGATQQPAAVAVIQAPKQGAAGPAAVSATDTSRQPTGVTVVGGSSPMPVPVSIKAPTGGNVGATRTASVQGKGLAGELKSVSVGFGASSGMTAYDTPGQTLLLTLKTLLDMGQITGYECPKWIRDHGADAATLIGALEHMTLEHPMDPIYLPICQVLLGKIGPGVEGYLALPYKTRFIMGIYLGVLEREEDARKLILSAVTADEMTVGEDLYHVANELVFVRRKSPRLAIWAWKHGAAARGAADEAFVCMHIRKTCEMFDSPEMVREELVPWAEEALSRPGSEAKWGYAFRELIWAYDFLGESQTAVARGEYWAARSAELRVPPATLLRGQLQLARIHLEHEQPEEAARILHAVAASAPPGSWEDNEAEARFLDFAKVTADGAGIELQAPRFAEVFPGGVKLRARLGDQIIRTIAVTGNVTFRVTKVHCTLPFVETSLGERRISDMRTTQVVKLSMSAAELFGARQGKLTLETNDRSKPVIEMPATAEVIGPLVARPDSFVLGLVKPGSSRSAEIVLTSALPFKILRTEVDRPAFVAVETASEGNASYRIRVTLRAPDALGVIHGRIEVVTDLAAQQTVSLEYFAQIDER